MTVRSYQKQHLAAYAAGFISADGNTTVTHGMDLTRIGTGHYGVVLDANSELQDRFTFTYVAVKGTNPRHRVVEDTTNRLKTVRLFDTTPTSADAAIEVILFRSVANF